MKHLSAFLLLAAILPFMQSAHGAVKLQSKSITYEKAGESFEGLFVYPESSKGKVPGVLMVHNWMGVTEETKKQAERIAALGYAVFAVDVYGKGVRPKTAEEAGALSGKYKADRALLRDRLALGLATLKEQAQVEGSKLLVLGYCFGGTAALELARAGADVKAAVSFHGGLDSPAPADGKNIKGRILALHGADDPYVKAEDLAAFEAEMRSHKIDWQLVKYGNAVHSFTEKAAGDDNSKGAAYNAKADARSFQALTALMKEVF